MIPLRSQVQVECRLLSFLPTKPLGEQEYTTLMLRSALANLRPVVIFLIVIILLLPLSINGQIATSDKLGDNDLAAAEQGNVEAQLRVAKLYNDARRNYGLAFKWFEAASKQGSLEATAWLGSLYLYGHGVAQDAARGASLIQKAAGGDNPVGQRFLGMMYQDGVGVLRDYSKAFSFYSKAAAQQDAPSFDRIGSLYLHGLGVGKNRDRAFEAFTKGANLGDSWAQLHVGQMEENHRESETITSDDALSANETSLLRSGKPWSKTPPDYVAALKWYADSAAQGNRVAAYKAGKMFEAGRGTAQNSDKALDYYRQSANRRYPPAQTALGKAYEFGVGVHPNLVYAYVLYSLAADQNDSDGIESLRRLRPKLTPSQTDEANAVLKTVEERRILQ
ncbi:MAG: SEL1-like repeat protein [Terriglobales bacterium]